MSQHTPGPWVELEQVKLKAPEMLALLWEILEAISEDGQLTKDTDIVRDIRALLREIEGEDCGKNETM